MHNDNIALINNSVDTQANKQRAITREVLELRKLILQKREIKTNSRLFIKPN
jgi:tmRNA-binding protein